MDSVKSQNEDLFDFKKELLKDEINVIHSKINTYNDLSFKIKGWAVTIWSGFIAYGTQNKDYLVILASLPALITFWTLDAYFKQYQRRSMFRMGRIEKFFDSKQEDYSLKSAFEKEDFGSFPVPDPIGNRTKEICADYRKIYLKKTNYWRCFFRVPNVSVFYLILIFSSIALASYLFIN